MNDAWNIKLQTIRTLLNRSDPLMQSLKVSWNLDHGIVEGKKGVEV